MGAVLEPLEAAAPWTVEVRTESAWLNARHDAGDAAPLTDDRPKRVEGCETVRVLSVHVDDRAPMLAAVDQILDHPAYARYVAAGHVVHASGGFDATVAGDRVTLTGPWDLYREVRPAGYLGDEGPAQVVVGGEVAYRHLASMHAALAAVAR